MGSGDDLASLAAECAALGVRCLTFAGDVRDDAAVTAAVQEAVERFGRIDVLFNNAGICAYGLAHELTEEAWDAMIDINLKGPWLVARRVIPVMIAQRRGVIVNNSSVAGLRGMARLSHYAASKWGLTGLTKSWAIELAPHGIRVNTVAPGNTAARWKTSSNKSAARRSSSNWWKARKASASCWPKPKPPPSRCWKHFIRKAFPSSCRNSSKKPTEQKDNHQHLHQPPTTCMQYWDGRSKLRYQKESINLVPA